LTKSIDSRQILLSKAEKEGVASISKKSLIETRPFYMYIFKDSKTTINVKLKMYKTPTQNIKFWQTAFE